MREGKGFHPGWLVVTLVAATIAAPVGAVAATQLVKVTGASGNVAQVDAANRLLTADSAPDAYFQRGYLSVETGACTKMFKAATTKAVLVRQIFFAVKTDPSFDASHGLIVTASPDCSGASQFLFIPSHIGTETFQLDPPLPVPAGGSISMTAFGSGVTAEVLVRGSTAPAASVP
jgi:hypothetical protein